MAKKDDPARTPGARAGKKVDASSDRPLFAAYPALAARLPHVSLGSFPTPLEEADGFAQAFGIGRLLVKRDDLSAVPYGGNKVRKLEFLLAEARARGARTVMTFGGAGSNHALATAIYARRLGLRAISILRDQANARYVRANLLMSHAAGAEMHVVPTAWGLKRRALLVHLRERLARGTAPWTIPSGGSSPLGTVGFVNAAFEMRDQLRAAALPEPDLLYVAVGTGGTAAGLMLGLRAAGMKTRVVGVQVVPPVVDFTERCLSLVRETNMLLHDLDPAWPIVPFAAEDAVIRREFLGEGYAVFSEKGLAAVEAARRYAGLKLEGTYTGKTLAAVLADARRGLLRDRIVLFWNTCNSHDFSGLTAGIDYHALPVRCHRYFEAPVQPRDRAEHDTP